MADWIEEGVKAPAFALPADDGSKMRLSELQALNFALLADTDHAVAAKYGAWREKTLYGKKMGIQRSTYLIDAAGKVAKVWRSVRVDGHEEQVLQALAEL